MHRRHITFSPLSTFQVRSPANPDFQSGSLVFLQHRGPNWACTPWWDLWPGGNGPSILPLTCTHTCAICGKRLGFTHKGWIYVYDTVQFGLVWMFTRGAWLSYPTSHGVCKGKRAKDPTRSWERSIVLGIANVPKSRAVMFRCGSLYCSAGTFFFYIQ